MRLGLADAVDIALAQRLPVPAILSFDGHYLQVAPRTEREPGIWVAPGPLGRPGVPCLPGLAAVRAGASHCWLTLPSAVHTDDQSALLLGAGAAIEQVHTIGTTSSHTEVL